MQLSVSLHSRPEILSSGSVSSVWFRCQLNKTFLVFLPDARQLISTVLRTAVQPLCRTKNPLLRRPHTLKTPGITQGPSFEQRIPHQTQDYGKSVLEPAALDRSEGFQAFKLWQRWTKVILKVRQRENQSSKSQLKHLVYIDPPIPPPCRVQNTQRWCESWVGRKSESAFWRRAGRGHKRPFMSTEQPQPRHRCFALTTLQPADSRRKQEWNERDVRLSHVTATCANIRPSNTLQMTTADYEAVSLKWYMEC